MGFGSLKKLFRLNPLTDKLFPESQDVKSKKNANDAALNALSSSLENEKEKNIGYEEQIKEQEAMRKKIATLGRVASGSAFLDTRVGNAKVYS